MKATFFLFLSVLCPAIGMAQGKLFFTTDSLHLVYYDASAGALAGSSVSPTNMPPGVTLVADLYGGSTSTALSLVSTKTFGTVPGRWTSGNISFNNPALPAGVTAWFQVQVRDAAFSNATTAASAGGYAGFSQLFSAVPQPSSFPPIYQSTSPVFSTWAAGTFNMDSLSTGYRGAIPVGITLNPPTILVNPISGRTVPIGTTVQFQVSAQGNPPLAYQWFFGTNEVAGVTGSTLSLTNVQPSHSGVYSVVVTNVSGSVTSAPATLTVLATLEVRIVPAITLTGTVGQNYRVDYINSYGPVTNWVPLDTITLTNTGQLYFDLSAFGQPARFYRLVEVP